MMRSGTRVRAVQFAVDAPGITDPETGLIRNAAGEVVSVDDNVTVPPGTCGTVDDVDDMGTIHVHWDNGSRLGLIPGRDKFEVL